MLVNLCRSAALGSGALRASRRDHRCGPAAPALGRERFKSYRDPNCRFETHQLSDGADISSPMTAGPHDPRDIPILDGIRRQREAERRVLRFQRRARGHPHGDLKFADSLLRQAARDIEATLFERVFDRLRNALPELVDRALREHARASKPAKSRRKRAIEHGSARFAGALDSAPAIIDSPWIKRFPLPKSNRASTPHWEARGYFEPSGHGPPYSIVIPPPNVTGTLHMGHAFQDTIMDALIRYRRMRGFDTLWQPGMDHAGIATQMVVERQLNAAGQSRLDLGREAFIERVWAWKNTSGGIHRAPIAPPRRLGRLEARQVHHGSGALAGGHRGFRAALPRGPDLSRQAAGQLGSGAQDRAVRSGGGRRGGVGQSVAPEVSACATAAAISSSRPRGRKPCWAMRRSRFIPTMSATGI